MLRTGVCEAKAAVLSFVALREVGIELSEAESVDLVFTQVTQPRSGFDTKPRGPVCVKRVHLRRWCFSSLPVCSKQVCVLPLPLLRAHEHLGFCRLWALAAVGGT